MRKGNPEFQNQVPFNDARVERETERRQDAEKLQKEGLIGGGARRIKESVMSSIAPESYIGEKDASLFHAAGYGPKEMAWIADVKRLSRGWPNLSAYDLIYAHALLGRDVKKLGAYAVSTETEKFIDDILLKIAEQYQPLARYFEASREEKKAFEEGRSSHYPRGEFYDHESEALFFKYRELCQRSMAGEGAENHNRLGLEKASLLTRWLGLIHKGGNREVVDIFKGYPEPSDTKGFRALQSA